MQSINFEILRKNSPELADLAGFAEQYVYQDPSSCLVKLRSFIERMLTRIYAKTGLPKPFQPNLLDLLNNDAFRSMVPSVVLEKFHSIRIHGNKAAHGDPQTKEKSIWLLGLTTRSWAKR